jgi:ABC-type multidrug transport system fused ATPase/permease subunit
MGPGAMARGQQAWGMPGPKVTLQSSPWVLLRRLVAMIRDHDRALIITFASLVSMSALQMTMPWAFKHVIDVTIPERDVTGLIEIGVALVAMQAVRYGLGYLQRYYISFASQQLVFRIARDLFTHIQKLSLRFYERNPTGEIISRITNDIQAMQQAINGGTIMAFVGLLNMVAFGAIMLVLQWKLALVVFVTVPVLVGASQYSATKLRDRYQRVQEKAADVNNVLSENISGMRVAKAFAQEGRQRQRFGSENRGNLDANMSTASVQAVATPAIQMISAGGTALVFGLGTWFVIQGDMTIGALVAFNSYLIQFYQPVEDLIRVNDTLQQALAAAERIFEYMDETPDVEERISPPPVELGRVEGSVRFEGVTFAYEPGKPVLREASVDVRPGEVVALVGHTGSGKTTFVNLLPRFYDPMAGRILVDGHDVRDVTLASLRANLAVVIQETFLFGATMRDNIRYGRLDATDAEVEAAAREAHADEFIRQLPKGYDAWGGDGGALISRGQRQRISLARAILKDPRILVLDEATSDVDTETEVLIQAALERVMRGRTTFVIAHRLSTVRHADQILVLEHGRIVERGTHDALLTSGGAYADLYRAQFADQEVATTV